MNVKVISLELGKLTVRIDAISDKDIENKIADVFHSNGFEIAKSKEEIFFTHLITNKMKTRKNLSGISLFGFICILFVGFTGSAQDKWAAPESADKIANPLKDDANAAEAGKKIYKVLCVVCHGAKGKGDGVGGAGLTPKPTNLTTAEVQSQTDGAIFWKILEGRPPMASYKTVIPEKNRWEIINYIRTLKQ